MSEVSTIQESFARGGNIIPATDIFLDESIRNDCEKIFYWLSEFMAENLALQPGEYADSELVEVAGASFSQSIPRVPGLYIPGQKGREWLLISQFSHGTERTTEDNGNRETRRPDQVITVSVLSPERHTPQPIFITQRTPISRSGHARWATGGNNTATCMLLTGEGWTQFRDMDFNNYDYYDGEAVDGPKSDHQKHLNAIKLSNDQLRDSFIKFIEYIS